jgi:uncharacterized protein (TIGR02145 family)
MKTKIYSLFAIMTLSVSAWSQGVGVNETGASPDPSAILDASSTTKGFLPPRMTTTQRNAISNPAVGLLVYNTTIGCLQINDGTPTAPLWNCISNIAGFPDGAIASINCAGATHSGSLIPNQTASGVNSVIAYTGGNGGMHSGQVVNSTGVTGLTATLTVGALANGAGTLTYTITGTPTSEGTASFAINIGGQSCTLNRTVIYPTHPNVCNPSNPTTIVDVTNAYTGKTWMDRNLGANRAAISSTDAESYGSIYQWGRGSDGHQCVNRYAGDGVTTSGTTNTTTNSNTPGHGNFITRGTGTSPFDWRNPQNNSLWQGVSGANNPCPSGYRLPTEAELNNERLSWVQAPINSTNDAAGAFASPIKLPMAGYRARANGAPTNVGSSGWYWSSTVTGTQSKLLYFISSTATVSDSVRAEGSSVRCIKN